MNSSHASRSAASVVFADFPLAQKYGPQKSHAASITEQLPLASFAQASRKSAHVVRSRLIFEVS